MKIINWVTGRSGEEEQQQDNVDSIVDEFISIDKPAGSKDKSGNEISVDADHFRQTHSDKIPVLIKPDLKIKELKRTLFAFDKKFNVAKMHTFIACENKLTRGKYHFYIQDSAGTKTLLPAHVMLADLDVFGRDYLVIHMGSSI